MFVAALVASLFLAAWLSRRRWHPLPGILLPAALAPLDIAFEALVYPADPETRMWFHIMIVTVTIYGLIAATIGYVGAKYLASRSGA
jgi:hypothetical protein